MVDAKKRTELREAVAVAKAGLTNLLGHIPTGEGKTVDTDRQLEMLNNAVLAIADYILEADHDTV